MLPTQLSPTLHVQHDPSPGLDNNDRARLHATPDASATIQKGSNLNRRRGVSFPPAPTTFDADWMDGGLIGRLRTFGGAALTGGGCRRFATDRPCPVFLRGGN